MMPLMRATAESAERGVQAAMILVGKYLTLPLFHCFLNFFCVFLAANCYMRNFRMNTFWATHHKAPDAEISKGPFSMLIPNRKAPYWKS